MFEGKSLDVVMQYAKENFPELYEREKERQEYYKQYMIQQDILFEERMKKEQELIENNIKYNKQFDMVFMDIVYSLLFLIALHAINSNSYSIDSFSVFINFCVLTFLLSWFLYSIYRLIRLCFKNEV